MRRSACDGCGKYGWVNIHTARNLEYCAKCWETLTEDRPPRWALPGLKDESYVGGWDNVITALEEDR